MSTKIKKTLLIMNEPTDPILSKNSTLALGISGLCRKIQLKLQMPMQMNNKAEILLNGDLGFFRVMNPAR